MKNVEKKELFINEEEGIQFYVDILSKQDDPVKFYIECLQVLQKFEQLEKGEGEHLT